MDNTKLAIVAIIAVTVVAGGLLYQRQIDAAARARAAANPVNQIVGGLASLVGGIVGAATGGGDT